MQCNQIRKWFLNANTINLKVSSAAEFPNSTILQATYIDHNGIEYKSINAIACSLEHINLAYATLGWFMRFPIINFVLQSIIDSMQLGASKNNCKIQ